MTAPLKSTPLPVPPFGSERDLETISENRKDQDAGAPRCLVHALEHLVSIFLLFRHLHVVQT